MTVMKYVDSDPSVAIADITEHLINEFRLNNLKVFHSTVHTFMRTECNLSLKKAEFHSVERNSPDKINDRYDRIPEWDKTDMNFLTICVFLDESPFHINVKHTRAWSTVGTHAVVTVPTTRAKTTTVLGAISASGLIKVSVTIPSPSKKRKAGQESGILTTGTVTSHYISFLKETFIDEMDKHPHMKGYYLIMNNAMIHPSNDIAKYIVDIDVHIFFYILLSLTQ